MRESRLGLSAAGRPLHSTGLLAEVERCAEEAGGWGAVDLIAVGLGPGSFTGLRVGIATAHGIVAAAGVAARGVGTLDALAAGIPPSAPGAARLAVLDGYRGEAFAALYGDGGERLWEPSVMAPAALAERVTELPVPPATAGSGAVRFRGELSAAGVRIADDDDPVHRVAGRHVCALAAGDDSRPGSLEPIYLRPPDAERWRARDPQARPQ